MSSTLKNLSPKPAAGSQSGLQHLIMAVVLSASVGGGSVSMVSPARSDVVLRSAPTVTDVTGTDLALAGRLLAQAGSIGGSVAPPAVGGREGKSVSGGEPAAQAPPPAAKTKKRPTAGESPRPVQAKRTATTAGQSCRSIVGTWSSVASGRANDTQFHADGTITRPASKGAWSCENGQYTVVWRFLGRRGPFRLSADGKQLIKDGSVGFYRDGGAPGTSPVRRATRP
jgi:hypothetical protein